jgi:DNA repair exonuclease SbcCD ATPase subunit
VDFLSKTIKKNEGEMQQYYIKNSHPAIIDPEIFDLVQSEIKKRKPNRRQLNSNSPFAAKIICSECGGYYGSKVWHSNSKYRNLLWQCNRKYADGKFCETPHIREDELKPAFIQAFNRILGDKDQYITSFEGLLPLLVDTSILEKRLAELQGEHDSAMSRMHCYMEENTRNLRDQDEYNRHFRKMSEQCKELENKMTKIKDEILELSARKEKIRRFLDELRQMNNLVTEFDENL